MPADSLPTPIQESVLCALAFDDNLGALIAAQLEHEHFDDPYREIARRILDYRHKQGRAPGQAHLDDLFSDALDNTARNAPTTRRVLLGLAAQAEHLNVEYVASRVGDFIRSQRIKQGLLRASARYQQGGEAQLDEVEAILHEALRQGGETLDAGVFLNDTRRGLAFLDLQDTVIKLGIRELDVLNIGPARKELLLYIAPKGTGKTWFSVWCGKQGFLQRENVLHITLETRTERVIGRYYQSLFSLATRPTMANETVFEFDKLKQFAGFKRRHRKPTFDYKDPHVRKKLQELIKPHGARLGQIVVREFPTSSLTMSSLISYLDYLEQVQQFFPSMVIIDSPDLMKIPLAEFRLNTRRIYEELRGLAAARNIAIVAPTQGNRESIDASTVRASHISEDISKVQTADTVMTYSATKFERKYGVARLAVEHSRNTEDKQIILLAQNYSLGQYVTQSTFLDDAYWDYIKMKSGGGDSE